LILRIIVLFLQSQQAMSDRSDSPAENPENAPEEPEALAASDAAKVMDSFEQNRNKILIGFALATIIICAVLISGQLKRQKHLDAARAYSAALEKKEVASFDAVIIEHPGSLAAGNAMISKAELLSDQGKPEDARSTLETFVSDYSEHPRHAQGLFALGNLYHVSGDREKAADFYQQSIDAAPDAEMTPLARIRLGDLALEAGDMDAADQRYQESFTLHPGNRFIDYAEEKIALLKVGNPPAVKRPAPEPEPKPEEPAPKAQGKGGKQNAGKAKAAAKAKSKAPAKAKGPGNGKAKNASNKITPVAPKAKGPQAKGKAPAQPKSDGQ
jgi:tetratricopeptide (TPR) repeat protein